MPLLRYSTAVDGWRRLPFFGGGMTGVSRKNLHLALRGAQFSAFYPLFQQGVRVTCRVGGPLGELLGDQWGLNPDYVSRRITTLFLNSRAVDDIATAVVQGGAVIALSGAMPGLVGATMRRGGFYAAMRGAMTHHEGNMGDEQGVDWVRVKLFNLLLKELGPGFLARGIVMSGRELVSFLAGAEGQPEQFIDAFSLEGEMRAEPGLLAALAAHEEEELLLTVEFEDNL